ncbi:MAG TPA: glycosyltransferase family 4 protein [Gemmatimonadaceae bacterium]|nr:glycosyltransferase family 4 protein [Gemmatimonadaceae bacterium]
MTAVAIPPRYAPPPDTMQTLQTLQLGMEWFSEKAGGLNRMYMQLVGELTRSGVELHGLVAGSPDVARASDGLVHAFAPSDAPLLARMTALRDASAAWLRERPDAVIVSHFAMHAFPVLPQVARHPLVVHFQGPWGQESGAEGAGALPVLAKEMVERTVYGRAAQVIVLSAAFRDVLMNRFGVPLRRIHVIPGGVDVDRFAGTELPRRKSRRALGWPTDRPIVLCVRRLVRRVGVDTLVEAAVSLRERVPDALVLIAGTGPLQGELEARIAALGLGDHVRLLGFVPDDTLPMLYRAADLSVVPSSSLEGFGLVTVESLAAGTPCVVTPVGGLTDVVTPFAPQLVTESTSAADIGAVLAAALHDEIPVPSAAECVAYARRDFDWPVVAARVRHVYELARA